MLARESINVCVCVRKNKMNETLYLFKKDFKEITTNVNSREEKKLFAYGNESGKAK